MLTKLIIFLSFYNTNLITAYPNNIIEKIQSRIINGENTVENEFPFLISISHLNFVHICGGSIISERFILTAAHCLVEDLKIENYKVFIGSNRIDTGREVQIDNFKIHENYIGRSNSWLNDIAVIKLKNPLKWSNSIRKIKIRKTEVIGHEQLEVAGWGYTMQPSIVTPNTMQKLSIKHLPQGECIKHWSRIVPTQLCFWNGIYSYKGICQGDSGGPVFVNNEQVGIVSWTSTSCAYDKPDVSTRVSSYLEWIYNNTDLTPFNS